MNTYVVQPDFVSKTHEKNLFKSLAAKVQHKLLAATSCK